VVEEQEAMRSSRDRSQLGRGAGRIVGGDGGLGLLGASRFLEERRREVPVLDREWQVADCVDDGAVRSPEARDSVEGVLLLVGELSNTPCEARVSEEAGGGSGEDRRSEEAV
jgi:hypothetical protein